MASLCHSRMNAQIAGLYVMMSKHAIFLGLVLVPLIGCDDNKAWRTSDSWYRPPQIRPRGDEHPLPNTAVHEVISAKISLAEQKLAEVSCIEISDESASAFAGRSIEREEGKDLYLLRGVCLNRGTGKFRITLVGRDLLVHHGSLGRSAVDMKRQPLIVSLRQKLDQVFVSCSLAE